jgi:hypothetical protein
MWIAFFALALGADLVRVQGVGEVTLDDAVSSCLAGEPRGAFPEEPGPSGPVFPDVVRPLLDMDERDRTLWFGRHRDAAGWPHHPADVNYEPNLPAAPPYVAAACQAASRHVMGEVAAVSVACRRGRDDCEVAVDVDAKELKIATKLALRDERDQAWQQSGSDPWAVHLAGFVTYGTELGGMLVRGCQWPGRMARQGLFVTETEVLAARATCLQGLALLGATPDVLRLPCHTGWENVAFGEWDAVRPTGQTDAGFGRHLYDAANGAGMGGQPWAPRDGVKNIERTLSRMDPSPGVCKDADWSVDYKRELVDVWRNQQMQQACDDNGLALGDRAHLCPGLSDQLVRACRKGDALACSQAGDVFQQGFEVSRDRAEAARHFGSGCLMGYDEACLKKLSVIDEMKSAFAELMNDGHLSAAAHSIESNATFMDAEWIKKQLPKVFEAALKADRPDLAASLLDDADASGALSGWLPSARKRVAAARR